MFDCRKRHISSTHKLLVKSAFPRHFTQIYPKTLLRYPLRQNPLKSSVSPFFTLSKITTLTPKIPSNPYKIRFPSNSTENSIFNKEITLQNQHIYNSSIAQITSKINTFSAFTFKPNFFSMYFVIVSKTRFAAFSLLTKIIQSSAYLTNLNPLHRPLPDKSCKQFPASTPAFPSVYPFSVF